MTPDGVQKMSVAIYQSCVPRDFERRTLYDLGGNTGFTFENRMY